MRYWDLSDWLICGLLVLLAACLPLLVYSEIQKQRQWDAFAKTHACRIVGRKEGSASTGVAPIIGGNGGVAVTTSTTPDQTAYLCDDGVTYWRNK